MRALQGSFASSLSPGFPSPPRIVVTETSRFVVTPCSTPSCFLQSGSATRASLRGSCFRASQQQEAQRGQGHRVDRQEPHAPFSGSHLQGLPQSLVFTLFPSRRLDHCRGKSIDSGIPMEAGTARRSTPDAALPALDSSVDTQTFAADGSPKALEGVIAVTGFGEFLGVKQNPTERLVQRLLRWKTEGTPLVPQGSSRNMKLTSMLGCEPGTWTGAAAEALPGMVLEEAAAAAAYSQQGPSLAPGWVVGQCSVLTVAGRDALLELMQTLAHPFGTSSTIDTSAAVGSLNGSTFTPEIGSSVQEEPSPTSPGVMPSAVSMSRLMNDGEFAVGSSSSVEVPVSSALVGCVSGLVQESAVASVSDSLEGAWRATAHLSLNGLESSRHKNGTSLSSSASPRRLIWLHLGVASGSTQFSLELQAANEASFRCPDQLGWTPWKEAICPEDGSIQHVLETDLPVDWLISKLRKQGFAVGPSRDAGRFVCNYVYYQSLRNSSNLRSLGEDTNTKGSANHPKASSLFVHVPSFSTVGEARQLEFLSCLLELLSQCL